MTLTTTTCKLCRQRPAVLPDREGTSGRSEVCAACYRERLLSGLQDLTAAVRRCPRCEAPMFHSRLAGYRCPRGCQ